MSRYCNGSIMPPIDVLISICKELDVSADYLLGLTD
ncbi:MAG: helix-turn-helix domain-containing protein [Clostridia bacterium]|nr:helix-turn-helix domain-containing protein [Clostridia bacterium]